MKNLKYKRGFTLIELLVVIAIIGILSSVVLASLNSARIKARDAKRKSDFHSIRLALEMYFNTYGVYPPTKPGTSCGGTSPWAESYGTCGGQWLTSDSNFYQFMSNVPIDPTNSGFDAGGGNGNNVYSYMSHNLDYDLLTQLENTNDKSKCGYNAYYYHNVKPYDPWCAPWANNMGRSQNIYADH